MKKELLFYNQIEFESIRTLFQSLEYEVISLSYFLEDLKDLDKFTPYKSGICVIDVSILYIDFLVFSTKNQSGTLVKVLNVFDSLNINLLYIDSRPSKKNLGEYVFFTDFEGHIEDEPSQKVLDLIKLNTTYIKVFGSYKRFL